MAFNPADHMMSLKGKDYLQVMWRLVWFREEHPTWGIQTELVSHDTEAKSAVFRASIIEPNTEQVISTGYGSESARDFGDYLEKAETKAVGRALAMLGYGTQFAPELDEGERIVDSPAERKKPAAAKKPTPEPAHTAPAEDAPMKCDECGHIITAVTVKGKTFTASALTENSTKKYGKRLCYACTVKANHNQKGEQN